MADKVKIFGIEITFGKSKEDLAAIIKQLDSFIVSTKEAKTLWESMVKQFSSSKEIQEAVKMMQTLQKAETTATKTRKALTAEQRYANTVSRENRREEDLKLKSQNSLSGSIRQLEADIALLNIEWKKLSETERNSPVGQQMTEQLTTMRTALRTTKVATGDFSNNIGNYMSAVYNKTTMMIGGAIGVLYGLQTALRALYSDFQNFEYKMSVVGAVSGATADELDRLEANARLLGATTEYTATQVADLQLAYSRMGFVPDQIIEMTGATLDLATATGEDLAKSADVAGVVIKSFGLSAKDSTRVVDVMTKSFSNSSLQLDTFAESIKYVAPVAKLANISLEETAAMLGVLADNGVRGSQAGTALRRIFTDISKEGGSVTERLAELSEQGITLGDAMDEVGRTAMTALAVLAESGNDVATLTAALNDAEGAAKSMADLIRDNLKGDLDSFFSALKEQSIAIGDFLSPATRAVIQFGTAFVRELGSIAKSIGLAATAVAVLNTALKAQVYWTTLTTNWTKLWAGSKTLAARATVISRTATSADTATILANSTASTGATAATKTLAVAKLLLSGNIKAATVAMKAFNVSLASSGVGLLLVALGSVVSYFVFFRKEADEATSAQERLNKAMKGFDEMQSDRRANINALISITQDETQTTAAQIIAYKELSALFPELTAKYNRYELAQLSSSEINRAQNIREETEEYEFLSARVAETTQKINELQTKQDEVSKRTKYNYQYIRQYKKEFESLTEELKVNEAALASYEQTRAEAAKAELERGKELESQKAILTDEQTHNQKLLDLKKQLLDGQFESEQQYREKVLQLEINQLKELLAKGVESVDDRIKIESELIDKLQQQRNAAIKIEEDYSNNRSKISDSIYQYESDNIDAQLALLEDGVDKQIKLNERATEKSLFKSDSDYYKLLDMLDNEQLLYQKSSEQWQAIEKQKAVLLARYQEEQAIITQAGVNKQEQIVSSASIEELRTYANVADDRANIEELITAKLLEETNKRNALKAKEYEEQVRRIEQDYTVSTTIVENDLTLTNKQREAALLESEIKLRQDLANLEKQRLQDLAASGEAGSEMWNSSLQALSEYQQELQELADGGNWLKSVLGLDDSNISQLKTAAIDAAQDISDAIFSIMEDASDRQLSQQLSAIETEYDTETALLQAKLDKNLITEAQYETQLAELEAESAAREEEAEKEAFEREKRLSLKQVLIDTALSISKTFATMGWPAGIPFAVLAAASGIAQAAVISAQQYAQGGIISLGDDTAVIKGRSHAQGGHQLYIDGRPIGEVEGDELIAIVNKKDTARIGALSAVNSVNGKKFADGGIAGTSYSSAIGYPAAVETEYTDNAWIKAMLEKMNDTITATNSRIDRLKVYLVAQDITEKQEEIKKIKTRATF